MEKEAAHFHLDLGALKNISVQGVRRAAAFLAIALNATQNVAAQSLSLPSVSMWRFFPEPVPEELLNSSVAEFRLWIVGCALRELDAAFNQFLDQAWAMNEWSKLHGQRIRRDHRIDTIDAKTNVGTKLKLLLDDLGTENLDSQRLWTMSNLRNCLTHARGVVTKRHANNGADLKVMWLGLDLGFQQGDNFAQIPNPIPEGGLQAPNPKEPASIVLKVVERERLFPIGRIISMEPGELHEICQYYLTCTDRAVAELQKALLVRGLEITEPQTPPDVAVI